MKRTLLAAIMILGFVCTSAYAEKINVQIIYDCSGSMGGRVDGKRSDGSSKGTKDVAARNAFKNIVKMVSDFEKVAPNTEINLGIISFRGGKNGVVLPLQKFDSTRVLESVNRLPAPYGNTPLGQAIKTAYEGLQKEGRSHIFVLTDGEENGNLKMIDVIASRKDVASLYFVAFDVNAGVFNDVKNLGAMVVQADNAAELNTSVQMIFSQNILLEKED